MAERSSTVSRRALFSASLSSALFVAGCAGMPRYGAAPAAEGVVAAGQVATGVPSASVLSADGASNGAAVMINGWMALDTTTAKFWKATTAPHDQWRIELTRRPVFSGPNKRIVAIYPRAGSAFDLGLNTIMQNFDLREIPCAYTVVNWHGDNSAAQAALALAESLRADLILSIGSDSTAYLYDHYRTGTIPVVTVVSKDPVLLKQVASYDQGSGTNIAYTSVSVPIDVQMTYLQELMPKITNISPLYEQSNVSAVQTQVEPLQAACKPLGIHVIGVAVANVNNAPAELQQKMPSAMAKMREADPNLTNSFFLVTGSTSVFDAISTVNRMAGKVPVVSMFPDIVVAGEDSAALSIGVSFATASGISAVYGAKILTGQAKAGDLNVGVVTPPDIAINFLKVNEIGLKIPFAFFESANTVYDTHGKLVRVGGLDVGQKP